MKLVKLLCWNDSPAWPKFRVAIIARVHPRSNDNYLHEILDAMRLSIIITIMALTAICVLQAAGEQGAGFWSSRAHQLYLNGSYEDAVKAYDKAIELDLNNASLYNGRGIVLSFGLDRQIDALAAYEKALNLDSSYADAFCNKGYALCRLGEYDEGLECYDKAIQLAPSFAEAWSFKGLALSIGLGMNDEALACLDKAVALDPNYYDAWINRGLVLSNIGKNDEAIACLERAIKINPKIPKGWNNEGVVFLKMGYYQDAVADFNKALRLDPSYEEARQNREMALSAIDQTQGSDLDDALNRARQAQGANMA